MKTFKQLIAEVAEPNNEDELNFKAKHSIEVIDYPASEESQHSSEKKSPRRRADYDKGEDEEVYEAKKLDPVGDEDPDIDNDGDTDDSDDYLHARRKAIAKAMKEAIEKKLDPVGKADADIDNDGDTDDSDEYLHARRAAIAKAMKKESTSLEEKAVSQDQQQAAGVALAVKRGEKPKSALIGASKEMYKMSEKDLEDFARTKHKGLPVKIQEANSSKIIAGLNAGDSVDVIVQNNLNKKGDNKDEILKVIRDYNWKKRMKKEEVELDEISKKTLGSYIKKAASDIGYAAATDDTNKELKRHKGIAKAANKLTKEEVEQIDEISDEKKKEYIRAVADKGGILRKPRPGSLKGFDRKKDDALVKAFKGGSMQDYANLHKKSEKRAGIALDTLNSLKKEEVSLDEAVAGPQDCWPGYRKVGTKMGTGMNAGKRVNDCEKINEDATLDKIRAILTKKNDGTKVVKDKSGYFHIKTANSHKGPFHTMKDVLADLSESALIVKAAAAHNDGKKKFNLDDEEFPVTIKPSTAKKIVKEKVELDENFKVGAVKLNDGSSIIIKDADAKLLNKLVSELSDKNREAMMKTAMKDKKGFNEILGFAKEAL